MTTPPKEGNLYFLVMVDYVTWYSEAVPLPDRRATTVAVLFSCLSPSRITVYALAFSINFFTADLIQTGCKRIREYIKKKNIYTCCSIDSL